jgi:histidine decarboxylase
MSGTSQKINWAFELQSEKPVPAILQHFQQWIAQRSQFYAGYPDNLEYDYEQLRSFFQFSLINAGDPFAQTDWDLHSKEFEQQCIEWFAQLYELQDYWGYVTSGGTEGNFYGMFLGRERYPEGVLYASRDSHYSINKAAYLFKIPHVIVNSQPTGEIDYDHLKQELGARQDRGAILNLNLGTTMKGAVDDVERVVEMLHDLNIQFHLHCDGALGGLLLPFIAGAPKISFQRLPIDSLAISGNKFVGAPVPHGIVLARRALVQPIGATVEYIGCTDTTILGVRNGLAPLFLWYALQTRGQHFAQEVATCLQTAQYLRDRLSQLGYNPMLNPLSNTVVFSKPAPEICEQWQLATEGSLAHIVVMQHFPKEKVDRFIHDLQSIAL